MADLNVSLAFLLDNLPEVAQELERAGGTAGADFGNGLSDGAKKALSDLVSLAEKAAKDVGLVFNRQKFQFETVKGDIVPPEALKNLGKVNDSFKKAQEAVQAFKSALPTSYAIDDRSIAALSNKLAGLKSKQLEINVDSEEFAKVQSEINTVERELNKIASKRVVIDASAGSVLALVTSLQDKLSQLQDKRLRVDVDSKDFQVLSKEIVKTEEELRKVERKQVEIDVDPNSLQGLQDKLRELQSKQTKVSVSSEDFVRLQREIDVIQNDLSGAEKARFTVSVDATSLQGLDGKLRDLQNRQAKVSVDTSEFTRLQTEIDKVQEEISAVQQKKILLNVDANSITALTTKLQTDIDKLRQRRVQIDINSTEFKTLSAEISKAERELQQLQQAAGNVGGFNVLDGAIQGVAFSLANTLTNGVGVALGNIRNMVGGFLELDGELRLAAAAAGETGGYERLGSVVQKVGIDAAGTSKQVAELATSLVRAGFSVGEVAAALPGVVRGAEATGTSFQQFGDIVGNTLRGFGLEVDETARVVDVLTNTANSSNASIEGLGYTFEYTAPIAKALGVSLEDVAAATGLMANAGIQGSAAGTGLREALQKLQQAAGGASPEVLGLSQGQERLQAVMKKLGASVLDASGKLLPLDQVFLRLKASMQKLSQGDQVQLANILFGDQAGNKVLAILNQTDAAITKMFGDIKNSSGATDIARNAMAGFGLELQQLQGTLDAIGTSIGSVAAAGLRPLVAIANQAAGAISGLPGPIKEAGGAIIAMGAGATTAAVGMTALNVAVNSLGGWAALATSIKSVVALLTGPIGAGTIAVLGLGAAAYGVYGAFNGVDSKTKALIQTMAGIAAFVAVMRGLVAIQELWNARLKVTTILMTAINALQGPSGIAKIAIAVAAAGAAYAGMGALIKETGGETDALAAKSKALKDEVSQLQSQIEQGKKLKVDTSELERLLSVKMKELQQIERPLEIKVNVEKAEAKIKQLQEQLNKLQKSDSGRPALETEIKAAERYRNVLKAADEGVTGKAFAKLDEESKKFIIGQKDIESRIQKLRSQQIELPITAKVEKEKIDKEISQLQDLAKKNDVTFKARIDLAQIDRDLEILKAKKDQAQSKPVTRGPFESTDNFSKRQAEQAKQIEGYSRSIYDLETKKATIVQQQTAATEKQTEALNRQVLTEQQKLELAKSRLSTEQQGIDLATKLMNLDKGRLATVQQIADAYSNLANAQAALTQSKFDVQSARNNRDITVAEKDLGQMKDQGASQEQVAAKEREIIELKKKSEEIEKAAMAAAIEGANKRFEIERKILELKQAAQTIEQQNAVRAAERGVIDDRKQLLDLQGQLKDPKLAPEQKAAISEQIKLQQQSIGLSQAQVQAEKERLGSLQNIFGLERQTLEAKQQTEANQLRGSAAAKGWEQDLVQGLDRLDQKAGVTQKTFKRLVGEIQIPGQPIEKIYEDVTLAEDATKQNAIAWKDVEKQAKTVLGTIAEHNKAIDAGKGKVGELGEEYRKAGSAKGGPDASAGGNGKALAAEAQATADATVSAYMSAEDRIMANRLKFFSDMIEAEKQFRKSEFTSIATPNFVYTAPPKVSDMARPDGYTDEGWAQKTREMNRGGKPWYGPEDLTAIMKIEKAAGMTAEQFFDTNEKATALGRTLAALGKEGDRLEKVKWFEKALDRMGQGGDMNSANLLADKKNLQWPNPLAGWEDAIDRVAAELADADAQAKGLKGSVEGARDALGRPIESTPFNLDQIYQNFVEDSKRALSPEAIKEAIEQQNFSLQDGIQVPVDVDTTAAKDKLMQLGSDGSIAPLTEEINGLKQDLDSLGYASLSNPFDQWSTAINETQMGVDSIAASVSQASVDAAKFGNALPDPSQSSQLQAAYDSIAPSVDQAAGSQTMLNDGTSAGISSAQQLAAEWSTVTSQIQGAVAAAQQLASTPAVAPRWAGGDASPGSTYQVNEFGTESFLSRSGVLSLINAPRYGHWTPSTQGMVLPAGITAHLQALGAFDPVTQRNYRAAMIVRQQTAAMPQRSNNRSESFNADAAHKNMTTAMKRQTAAMTKLQRSIDALAGKDWNVNVRTPSNAGLLRTLGLG